MFIHNRGGFVGFMLTMALGVALGAATLVVGNEVIKSAKNEVTKPAVAKQSLFSDRANAMKVAWKNYDQTRKVYEEAQKKQSPDLAAKRETMLKAKRILERAILGATPGMPAAPASEITSTSPAKPASAVSQGAINVSSPYDTDTITVTPTVSNSLINSAPQAAQTSTAPITSTAAPTGTSSTANSSASEAKTGIEYIRVRSGDSLSKICEKYYGDNGMWVHILKYQIPSIALNPNLIFPGQMIALPRNLGLARPPSSGSLTTPSTGYNPGSSGTAPPGDESWKTSFQKDYVVSDHTLTDANSLSVAQIQAFLDKKGSVLAKPYRDSTPAQMIYDAAQKCGISPKVILTRLQCEQGLISKKIASQKDLDWALGVGAYDSGNWNTKFKGFDKQIEGAAKTYRTHYDVAKAKLDRGEAVTMNIDGETVRMKTAATYAFYKYCPHFHGNKLFFDVWKGFEKTW